jgi:putative holliday junction resolvase
MNILGIDYGQKRIGLAWVDTALGVILPYGILNNTKEVIDVIEVEKIDKVVIGLPLGLDGKENENTNKVKKFVDDLQKEVEIPVELVDERFTSRQADVMGGDASRDEKSAMLILDSYIKK